VKKPEEKVQSCLGRSKGVSEVRPQPPDCLKNENG